MGVKAENLNAWWDPKQQRILLTFDCDHPAVVIGKEGKTLESIQYLITLMVSRDFENPISVMADTQNYWRKLEDKIDAELDKAIGMLKRTKRSYRCKPMPAQVRRYVHRYLAGNENISTVSEGEGKWRKVILHWHGKPGAKEEAPARPPRGGRQDRQERAPREEREPRGCEIAYSKADLTPVVLDEGVEVKCAFKTADKKEAPKAEIPANSADLTDKSGAVSANNAGESCVLTAESTACEDVADTSHQNPTEQKQN